MEPLAPVSLGRTQQCPAGAGWHPPSTRLAQRRPAQRRYPLLPTYRCSSKEAPAAEPQGKLAVEKAPCTTLRC
ncbi:hypothetical protein NDU88_002115 [Pleurodeles waltl]|uniref:Uncharacterized protein n=1 Tax=Pleurodeles waltl TaxID=8319 RepID=A0AAV7LBJ6_PLEWA|nr:hypothetical protein NDU88_002115 [Pleurodeles waltl]